MTALDESQRQQLRAALAQRETELLRELGEFQRDTLGAPRGTPAAK